MLSAKHCVLFYALAALPPSLYAVLRTLAPYRGTFVTLLGFFFVLTLVFLWIGPYRFLSVPRNTVHQETKAIRRSYLLAIGFYLVASGAFVEFLCGLDGEDRVFALGLFRIWLQNPNGDEGKSQLGEPDPE